jgi:hypothetical protein
VNICTVGNLILNASAYIFKDVGNSCMYFESMGGIVYDIHDEKINAQKHDKQKSATCINKQLGSTCHTE